jgi:hypothetical protein
MQELRMIIVPSATETRLWARTATRTSSLRATLPPIPQEPDALPRLLEALADFLPVRAALVVGGPDATCATRLYPGWFADLGGAGYDLEVVRSAARAHRDARSGR